MKNILIMVLAGLILIGCGKDEQQAKNMPPEQQFIVVSVGHYVPPDDAAVLRAKELIDRAAKTYGISRELVADQAYVTYKLGKEENIQVTAIDVLEGATLAYVENSGVDFSKSCAMYLTLRRSGMPHAESMMGLKGLITAIMGK